MPGGSEGEARGDGRPASQQTATVLTNHGTLGNRIEVAGAISSLKHSPSEQLGLSPGGFRPRMLGLSQMGIRDLSHSRVFRLRELSHSGAFRKRVFRDLSHSRAFRIRGYRVLRRAIAPK